MRLLNFLYYVRWQDVVDVLFLAFLLYRLTVLFWGTNAFQILLGISFVWLLGLGARATGLILTNWILQGLGAIIMIIMVVVFRNEIRDALFRINPMHLIMGAPRESLSQYYPGLSRAVFSLAGRRIGALLVFPQQRKVDEFIREGVEVRAVFSQALLDSIFNPLSPLHDGAAILEKGRITRAACFLPLTNRVNLPLKYGTRHRAAIGLTETSDALVVAVSEERGEVSVAEEGKLYTIPSSEALERRLGELLEDDTFGRDGRPKGHKSVFPRNWQARVIALVISVAIWFLFVGEKESLISTTVPLEFRYLPRTMHMVSSSADRVEVQISGRQHMIASFKPEQIKAFLDLENAKAGSNLLPLTAANVVAPVGIRVNRIFPSQVMVFMEGLLTRNISVNPVFTGQLPNEKKMTGYTVTPNHLVVTGPSSAVLALEEIRTDPINLGALDKNQEVEVGVILSPASISLGPNQPARVRVKLQVAQPAPAAASDTAK